MSSVYVYIDDTSFAGDSNQNLVDKSTVAWIAVILKEKQKQLLEKHIKNLLVYFGVSEFHFKEIYGKRGEFVNFSFEDRIKIVESFVYLYNKFRPMCLMKNCNETTIADTGFSNQFQNFKIDGFSFNKPKDYSLYILLLNIQNYIRNKKKKHKQYSNCQIKIIIDEGRQKAETTQKFFGNDVFHTELHYASSQKTELLQLADFLAFVSNRIVTNVEKERKSEFDKAFMHSVGHLRWRTNFPLLKIKESELDNLNGKIYNQKRKELAEKIEIPSKEMMQHMETQVRVIKSLNQLRGSL